MRCAAIGWLSPAIRHSICRVSATETGALFSAISRARDAEAGRAVLASSDVNIIAAESLTDAAQKVVAAAETK